MQRKRGLEIGRPLGFPLLVHGSWFPAGALFVAHLTISAYGGHDLLGAVLLSVSTVLLFFLSVAIKVLVQGLVAGIVRVPFADATLYIFGGITRSAREAKRSIQDLLVAATGPAVAGALGFAVVTMSHRFHGLPSDVLWTIGVANVALAIVNLLPATPLDGGRALVAFLSTTTHDRRKAEVTAGRAGQLLGLLSIVGGIAVVALEVAHPQDAALGLWAIVGGALIAVCATRSRRGAVTLRRVGAAKAGEWAKPFAGRVTLDAAVPGAGTFAVADGGRLAGVVSGRAGEPVRDVMVPWTSEIAVRSNEPVSSALTRLANGSVLVVVDESGTVCGVLDRAAVKEHI